MCYKAAFCYAHLSLAISLWSEKFTWHHRLTRLAHGITPPPLLLLFHSFHLSLPFIYLHYSHCATANSACCFFLFSFVATNVIRAMPLLKNVSCSKCVWIAYVFKFYIRSLSTLSSIWSTRFIHKSAHSVKGLKVKEEETIAIFLVFHQFLLGVCVCVRVTCGEVFLICLNNCSFYIIF